MDKSNIILEVLSAAFKLLAEQGVIVTSAAVSTDVGIFMIVGDDEDA